MIKQNLNFTISIILRASCIIYYALILTICSWQFAHVAANDKTYNSY